ncbi:hypothetical protein [Flavobacterium sp. N2038]|uniref:hypothetical protein n=1 Tax=Flavobacterium sp. N2038 TaxID=2986829 RepID=UPI0022240EFA|nr:hypothetical protein [Flavobacterium sp. N2038]
MKKEKRNKELTWKAKIAIWLKKPENILLLIILGIVTVIGIMDNNLDIILIVYGCAFLYGLLIGGIFYIKDKFF